MITGGLYRNGAESMAALADLVAGAQHSVVGDAFRFSDRSVVAATKDALGRGVSVDLVHSWYKSHWHSSELSMRELTRAGAVFHPIHVMQHGKGLLVDWQLPEGGELQVGSGATGASTAKRNDIALRMTGPAAAAFGTMERASMIGDMRGGLIAARDGADVGLLANDPLTTASFIAPAKQQLIRAEPQELDHITKSLRDRPLASLLAERAREIPVHVTARDMPMDIEEMLRQAGADVTLVNDPLHHSHTNILVGSQSAIFGSAHDTPRALNSPGARSMSRELSLRVDASTEPAAHARIRSVAQDIRAAAMPAVGGRSVQSRFEYWVRSRFGGFD